MEVPAILPGVILDMRGRVGDPAAGVVDAVGADGVATGEVPVGPRGGRHGGHGQADGGEEGRGEEEGGHGEGDPDRAGEERDRAQEDEAHHGARDRQARQDQEGRPGEEQGEEAHELRGCRPVGCLEEAVEEWRCG